MICKGSLVLWYQEHIFRHLMLNHVTINIQKVRVCFVVYVICKGILVLLYQEHVFRHLMLNHALCFQNNIGYAIYTDIKTFVFPIRVHIQDEEVVTNIKMHNLWFYIGSIGSSWIAWSIWTTWRWTMWNRNKICPIQTLVFSYKLILYTSFSNNV